MSGEHVFVLIGGIVIGLIMSLIAFLFATKGEEPNHRQRSGKPNVPSNSQALSEMKQEIARLQKEIDTVNRARRKALTNKGASTISSGYDYKSACDELELCDYQLLDEWNRSDTIYYQDSEEAAKLQKELDAIDTKIEGYDDRLELQEVLEQLEDLCFNNPEEVELLYRIGQVHVRLCEGQTDDVVKSHVEKGIEALSTALRLNDKHADVHKWYAILIGLRAQFQPLQKKAMDAYMIKKHCDLACALRPDDAVVHHILGRFDFEIASLGWIERKIAESILGETLNSTYSDALRKFMAAEKLSKRKNKPLSVKDQIENKKCIGNTLVAMGDKLTAEKWFKEAEGLGRLIQLEDNKTYKDQLRLTHQNEIQINIQQEL